MIRHLVMLKFHDTAQGHSKAENLQTAKKKALAMQGQIPQILSLQIYLGAEGSEDRNCDFLIDSTFADMQALHAYQVHPVHKAFGEFIIPLRAVRACIDHEV